MKSIIFTFSFFLFIFCPFSSFAQVPDEVVIPDTSDIEVIESNIPEGVYTEEVRVEIVEILREYEQNGYAQIEFRAEGGGEMFTVNTADSFLEGLRYELEVGDEVYLQVVRSNEGNLGVFLVDVVRTTSILWLIFAFAILILLIGFWRGFASLLGIAVTFFVLFLFIIPQILAGANPVLITIIGSIVILGVNMHLAHGFSKSVLFAFLSTLIGLFLAWIFGHAGILIANLSGLSSEESVLLFLQAESELFPAGILLAGFILGAVGVLDDIAITQSEIVTELKSANKDLSRKELFIRAMRVGQHHIASTVNTLVLAYAGVALPLLLLFVMTQDVNGWRFLNEEPIAEEVIRTLAGTMALVLTVPISTYLATFGGRGDRF